MKIIIKLGQTRITKQPPKSSLLGCLKLSYRVTRGLIKYNKEYDLNNDIDK